MRSIDVVRRKLLAGSARAGTAMLLSHLARGAAASSKSPAAGTARRLVIDTDPGVDDALAIFLALKSPELEVAALTAVAGNMPLDVTLPNALRLVEIAGRSDVPVAAGADRPLERRLITAKYVHGANGLGGVQFPEPRIKPAAESAVQLIRRIVRASPGEVSIAAIGPLTNIALAFREDPALPALIRRIFIMGGSLSGGNVTPAAEFNSYVDPEAAQAVYRSGAKITMVGLDVTRRASLDESNVKALESGRGAVSQAAGKIMRSMLESARAKRTDGHMLVHDAMAVAAAIDPTLFTLEPLHIEIETKGELTAGETLGYRHGPINGSAPPAQARPAQAPAGVADQGYKTNADVALAVDAARFVPFLIGRLAG